MNKVKIICRSIFDGKLSTCYRCGIRDTFQGEYHSCRRKYYKVFLMLFGNIISHTTKENFKPIKKKKKNLISRFL